MYANLHTLPADKALFTFFVTPDPVGTPREEMVTEEIDLVLPRRSSVPDLMAAVKGELAFCETAVRVAAIADQSAGVLVATDPAAV